MKTENIECSLSQLEQDASRLITQNLLINEIILVCIKYKGTGYYRVGVVTESKVIIVYAPEVFGRASGFCCMSIPMKDITGLEIAPYMKSQTRINICTQSNYERSPELFFSSSLLVDKFISIFQETWSKNKQSKNDNDQRVDKRSIAHRINELDGLYKAGIVTEAEFIKLREQILNDL